MWQMTYVSRKWLVFQKRLKYVGTDVDLWEMSEIYGEMA